MFTEILLTTWGLKIAKRMLHRYPTVGRALVSKNIGTVAVRNSTYVHLITR